MGPGERGRSREREHDVIPHEPSERLLIALDEGDDRMGEDAFPDLIPHENDVGIGGSEA
jgi:hypothetical protein